jgi:hypothetical protein
MIGDATMMARANLATQTGAHALLPNELVIFGETIGDRDIRHRKVGGRPL